MSEHFERHEFACKCGCGFDTVDVELIPLAEGVRRLEGGPVEVGCGCRCGPHNDAVGGAKDTSQHLFGRAGDFYVSDPKKTYDYLCQQYPNEYGFGLYDWGVHADTRTNGPARWDKRSKRSKSTEGG